jgi:uncharacterized membrane protein
MKSFAIALISFVVLDGLWLGVVMSGFYRTALGPIARTAADGSLAPLWLVAAPVYALLALGQVCFVLPRVGSGGLDVAGFWGALFGLVVYGVYDLTNWSVLRGYGPTVAVVDILWGMVACGAVSMLLRMFAR